MERLVTDVHLSARHRWATPSRLLQSIVMFKMHIKKNPVIKKKNNKKKQLGSQTAANEMSLGDRTGEHFNHGKKNKEWNEWFLQMN